MRNEMGNQNASGIKEEEKVAVEVPEASQEAAHEDVVKGENHVIPEGQTKDFHEKTESSDDLSVTKDSNAERHESDEKEQETKESEPPSTYLEAANHSNHLVNLEAANRSNHSLSQENCVEKADPPHESNYEKVPESNLEEIVPINNKIQRHDQPSIRRETDAVEVTSTNSYSESKNTFQDSKTVDVTTTPLEKHQSISSQESEDILKLSVSCHMEEKQNNRNKIDRKGNRDDLVLEESVCLEDKSLEMNICIENFDTKSLEDKVQHGNGNDGDAQLPQKENLSDFSSSLTERVPEVSLLDSLSPSPEPQEKYMVHAEEVNLTYGRSEDREKKPDSDQAQFSEQTVNQLMIDISTQPIIEHEACSKENGVENMVKMNSSSDLEKVYQTKGTKVIPTATDEEQFRDEKIVVMMPETFSESNGLTSIDKYGEGGKATKKLLAEETERSSSRHNAGAAEESVSSFKPHEGENYLVPLSPTPPFNSENGLVADSPTSTFNHQWDNGLCSEAAEDCNKCTVNLKQCSSCDVFIAEIPTLNAQNASMQTLNPCSALEKINHVQELAQNVQANSGTEADYKQHLTGETSQLPSSKAQESAARFSIESNPDHPAARVKLRKSPSFEFGIPLDARSEESDQTPLLVRDKSLARSFSGQANARFQNTMIATDYGRRSLDYEPVTAEEKTIRMERSDSDVSRDSFRSLLRKDVKPSAELTSEKKENHVADKKALDSPSEELALTSVKTSGKRKPRSSLFSACICCTAAIH